MSEYKPEDLEAQASEMEALAVRHQNDFLSGQNCAHKYQRSAVYLKAGAQAMRDRDLAVECVAGQNKLAGEFIKMHGDVCQEYHKAQERVKELEESARDYMAHTNSGMYRDKTGMRPEPSPQYERLFNLLHTEARAALQVKP